MTGVRTIEAMRAVAPPVIDGKLDDACWQKAKPVIGFLSINSDRPASYQSIGYVCYDDSHLYIGMKCLMPEGGTPAGKPKPHDTYVFSDDIVEIMLDPGGTRSTYYQLVISAYGATYDSARKGGGAQNDPAWNGDWTGAAYIGEGYWSAEMSIPFHNLGISPDMGPTWGINLCREAKRPRDEWSSIAARGTFNSASDFAVLKGLKVDFSKYYFRIGPGDTRLESAGDKRRALFTVPVANRTGRTKKVKIERWYAGPEEKDAVESKVVTLRDGERAAFSVEPLDVEALLPGCTDGYVIQSATKTKKIAVSDANDGIVLAVANVKRPRFFEPIRIQVKDPWQKQLALEKSPDVSLIVQTLLSQEQFRNGELVVTLMSKETGQTLATKSFPRPSETTAVAFSTKNLPWGAYEARAVFKDSTGREIVSSRALATVLPGGKQHIKVLNNMVSELMNAKERCLLGGKEIEFMNPRTGWVFFSLAGSGSATVDSESKPLAVAQVGQRAEEAMRYLAAGRHMLHTEGGLNEIIVRAVPELVYSCHPSAFSWEFLKQEVLPNCNTILGSNPKDEKAMREWAAGGKKWVTFLTAPGHEPTVDTFTTAEQCYQILAAHDGFRDPLNAGVMVDMIGGASLEQKMQYAPALSRIASDPKFKGRAFQPWYEGWVFGSEGDKAFMKVVLEAGWPFSYYVYLVEQTTEEQTRTDIQNTIVRIFRSGDEQIPGAMRRAIVTLGYWSDVTTGQIQDISPAVNFKVLMQMQQEALANDPALFGVYGVLWYYSPYVDEETLRWSSQLFRHYCIEGKTTKLTTDPYLLTHIRNPDFERGTESWTITEAEPGAVSAKTLAGYGSLQGRYLGGSQGDTFLVTKRSAKGPNKFSQEIKQLTPGRAYSVKMITADCGNISGGKSVKQADAISIQLDNADLVADPKKNRQETYPNHYAHPLGKFTGDYHAYLNYHWYVFRAKGSTARLTVADWAKANDPGGPVGQELMYNFIEIEPYLEDAR